MKHKVTFLLLLFSCFLVCFPLFTSKFFQSDDGEWMVIRFSSFYQELREGQIPPRFLGRLNNQYGYPVADFLYPGFMYAGIGFKLLGLGFVGSIKAVILSSIFISGIGMYLWLLRRFSYLSAFCGALLYVYFPYHIFDLYVRGSIGELFGLALIPWLFISIDRKQILLSGVLYAGLILSHNIFILLFTPIICMYSLLFQEKRYILFIGLGLLLSLFFWLPALYDLQYTIFQSTKIANWHEYFLTTRNITLLGIAGILLGIVACVHIFYRKEKAILLFSYIYICSIVMTFSVTSFLWDNSIVGKLVQFPWRFLLLAAFSGSFILAYTLNVIKKQTIPVLISIIIIVLSAIPYVISYKPSSNDDMYYATNNATTTVANEYMPIWVTRFPNQQSQQLVEVVKGKTKIKVISQKSSAITFSAMSSSVSTITISKLYFPGWQATVDNKIYPITIQKATGIIQLTIKPGNHYIAVAFKETNIRLITDIISMVTCIVMVFFVILNLRNKVLRRKGI